MLVLLWSLGLLFTAIITNTLSRTVMGHAMLFMTMLAILLTSSGTFRVLSCIVAFENLLVMFVMFESKRLAMLSRRKRYEAECFFGDTETEQFICCPVPVILRLFQCFPVFKCANVLQSISSHAVIV